MSTYHRVCIALTVLALVLCVVFPPWIVPGYVTHTATGVPLDWPAQSAGYAWITEPPYKTDYINVSRLIMQSVLVVVIGTVAFLTKPRR